MLASLHDEPNAFIDIFFIQSECGFILKFRAQILNFVGSLASVLDTVTIHVF
jgi:hypothetical protein